MSTAETSGTPSPARPPQPLAAAKAPVGQGAITFVGLVLALILLCLGVVGIHDALVAAGLVAGSAWIQAVVSALDGLSPAGWMVPAGVLLLVVGLWALITAVRPRPQTAIALDARTGVYLRPRDVARLTRIAVEDVDGVTSATVNATRRAVTVAVRATSTGQVRDQVSAAATEVLTPLATQPKVRVKVTTEAGTR